MRFSRISGRITVAVVLLAPTAFANHKNEDLHYVSPKLASGADAIHSVCVVPGEMQLTKVGMKGKEGMEKESENWGNVLQALVETHFKAAEVQVVSSAVSPFFRPSHQPWKSIKPISTFPPPRPRRAIYETIPKRRQSEVASQNWNPSGSFLDWKRLVELHIRPCGIAVLQRLDSSVYRG